MTGRVCPVHGEYSASGICRWCEPLPAPDGIDATNGRMSPPIPSEPVNLPGLKGLWQKPGSVEVNEAGVPTYTFTLTEKTKDAYRWRLEWRDVKEPEEYDNSRRNQYRQELQAQHAALRRERVARRWNGKHRRPGGLDEEGRAYVWMRWLALRGP